MYNPHEQRVLDQLRNGENFNHESFVQYICHRMHVGIYMWSSIALLLLSLLVSPRALLTTNTSDMSGT